MNIIDGSRQSMDLDKTFLQTINTVNSTLAIVVDAITLVSSAYK